VCVFILFNSFSYLSRQVDSIDGEKLAKENDCAWIETSAKNGTNISTLSRLGYDGFLQKAWGR
jgi:Ras family protein